MDNDSLGDRMKGYEFSTTSQKAMNKLPLIIRLDGKSFHTFTKGLQRPYDVGLSNLMTEVTKGLVEYTSAVLGYTQSDEITLCLRQRDYKSQLFFDGKIFKLNSVLASYCSVLFNKLLPKYLTESHHRKVALFDCRSFNVPDKSEALNAFLWRQNDATKNAISMAAQSMFSHKQLMGKNGNEMQEMMFQRGVNFNDYPAFFKRGSFVKRILEKKKFTTDEIEKLPEFHQAKKDLNFEFVRGVTKVIFPQISKLNKEELEVLIS